VEPLRERVEDFMRRYGFEGRVVRVLVVAVAVLLVLLLTLRGLRVLRVVVLPAAIGGILVVSGWLQTDSLIRLLMAVTPLAGTLLAESHVVTFR
jgi:hypothetical protein